MNSASLNKVAMLLLFSGVAVWAVSHFLAAK